MDSLSGIIVQHAISWENPESNRSAYDFMFRSYDLSQVDLIVLPEMFTTGFTMNGQQYAEDNNGPTMAWMIANSKEYNLAICGSIICREKDQFRNRFLFVRPNGQIDKYDKRHLFGIAGEDSVYSTSCDGRNAIKYLGWSFFPIICYDLRFPVWTRNDLEYDVMICVANWPSPRISAWDTLLRSRAIENQSYVVACNRIGFDQNALKYPGHSQVINPFGDVTRFSDQTKSEIIPFSLQKKVIENCRSKLPFLRDRDNFTIDV